MDQELNRIRLQLEKSRKLEGLLLNSGWKLIEEELEKLLEATRRKAVSPDVLGKPYDHASLVGAHNALDGFLRMVKGSADIAPKLAEKYKDAEQEYKDARKLRIHDKI